MRKGPRVILLIVFDHYAFRRGNPSGERTPVGLRSFHVMGSCITILTFACYLLNAKNVIMRIFSIIPIFGQGGFD